MRSSVAKGSGLVTRLDRQKLIAVYLRLLRTVTSYTG